MSLNAQLQAEEVEALIAIYDDDFSIHHQENAYSIQIRSDNHLISLELMLMFPEDYPSSTPPVYEIRCAPWIGGQELEHIHKHLVDLFNENGGEVIVYQWVEWLREFISEKSREIHISAQSDSEVKKEEGTASSCGTKPEVENNEVKVTSIDLPTPSLTIPTIIHGEPLTDRKSTFQAHAAQVTTTEEVKAVVLVLKQNRKIATATHNILAYRLYNSSNNTYQQDCDDDGEAAAGGRLLHLLQIMDVRDIVVVVTRWYGGIHLHADRFKHINNVARTLIQDTGIGLQYKDVAVSKVGKNSKAKTVSKSKSGRHR